MGHYFDNCVSPRLLRTAVEEEQRLTTEEHGQYLRYGELSLRFQDTIVGHLYGHM
jgi:hypothetical protein